MFIHGLDEFEQYGYFFRVEEQNYFVYWRLTN